MKCGDENAPPMAPQGGNINEKSCHNENKCGGSSCMYEDGDVAGSGRRNIRMGFKRGIGAILDSRGKAKTVGR